jgi:hypothetical protein
MAARTTDLKEDPMSATLLDDVRTFIRRFVVLDDAQAVAATLWAAHTHVFDAFGCTPYLAITSAEKRSGKTRLLEVLELLVREPPQTANISDAALFRVVAERSPILLMDEVDSIFKSREREELRGLLNAGYRRAPYGRRKQPHAGDVPSVLSEGVRRDRRLSAGHDH